MIRRRYVGIDFHTGNIRLAVLGKKWRKGGLLLGGQVHKPGVSLAASSLGGISAGEKKQLAGWLREVLLPLTGNEKRVGLSLPDRYGSILTLAIENFTRMPGEGREVVGWQLKKMLPGRPELHFDYQVLRREADGTARLLVVAAEKEKLGLYENLTMEAGFTPTFISFYGLSLYRHWRYRLDPEGNAILVALHDEGIHFQVYRDGVLEYYKSRATGVEPVHKIQELHRIVAGYGREPSGRARHRLFLHTDRPAERALLDSLGELFGCKVQVLEGSADSPPLLAAAVGTAECMMGG